MKKQLLLFIVAAANLVLLLPNLNAQAAKPDDNLLKKLTDTSSLAKPDTVKPWQTGGVVSLNLAQAAFINWSAGGENSVSINGLVSLFANYKKGNISWDNNLDLGYGLMYQGKDNLIKTDDKIGLSSKFGLRAAKYWYYSALLDFKTQFSPGYNYPNDSTAISNFLAPAYLTVSLGMDYRPNAYLSVFLSPVTERMTVVNDRKLSELGAFGVEPGRRIKNDLGGYIKVQYSQSFWNKAVSIQSKLELFSSYTDKPQNIDVAWENIIGLKVTKFISATISTQLIYDDDIEYTETIADGTTVTRGPRIQFKEIIGVGFLYKF